MRALLGWLRRLRGTADPARAEHDFAAELDSLIQMHTDDHIRRGVGAAEARRRALVEIGGLEVVKASHRDQRGLPIVQDLLGDLRLAARMIGRNVRFTVVVVFVLSLGMGVSAMQLTIINAHCFRGLPIADPDRVVFISTREADGRERGLSAEVFEAIRASGALAGTAAFAGGPVALGDEGVAPDRIAGALVSADALDVAGLRPHLGRSFDVTDTRPGAPRTAVLAHTVWMSRYGGDEQIVGRTVHVGGTPTTVIGVMPDGARFPNNAEIWQPLATPAVDEVSQLGGPLSVFGRLAEGSNVTDTRGAVEALARTLMGSQPATSASATLAVVPINDRFNASVTDTVWLAFVLVGVLVLLIACANVANLLLMRGVSRAREFSVRAALGASRGRLVRQSLAEGVLLGLLGTAGGLLLSQLGVRVFASLIPENGLPYWISYTLDLRLLLVLAAVSMISVIVFAVIPSLRLARTDAAGELTSGSRIHGGRRMRVLTTMFVTVEFALTMILVTSVFVGVRETARSAEDEIVIDTAELTSGWIDLSAARYGSVDQRRRFYDDVRDKLDAISPDTPSSIMSAVPFGGAPETTFAIDGASATGAATVTSRIVVIDDRYFSTLGISPIRGRGFVRLDGNEGQHAAIVNERFARLHFADSDPIGRRLRLADAGNGTDDVLRWSTIVGVSPDVHQRAVRTVDPVVYLPLRQRPPTTAAFIIRGTEAPTSLAARVREALRTIDPTLPMHRIRTMDQFLAEAGWNGRLSRRLLETIALVALVLAAAGLYAVTTYGVSQRTAEIALRVALGAPAAGIVWLVLKRALRPLGMGVLAGLVCTWAWSARFAPIDATGRQPMTDPVTLALVVVFLGVVGLVASLAPTRAALRVDPVVALRQE